MKNLRKIFAIIVVALLFALTGCASWNGGTSDSGNTTLFEITGKKISDSKLYNDVIISGNSGHLIFFNKKGGVIKEYPDVHVNWIYAQPDEGFIIAGNGDKEIRKITFDNHENITGNEVLFTSSNLLIDPIVFKASDDQWILTYTEIEGTVNNADPAVANGVYTVRCFATRDFKTFTPLSDIVHDNHNIEDGDIVENAGKLYYIYEKETLDKAPSALCAKSSSDGGKTWSDPVELVPAKADNEPASVFVNDDGSFTLYYSSDYADVGKTYNGASIYRADFTADLTQTDSYVPVDIGESGGILLYDVEKEQDGKMLYLYARNYLTDNTLVLKESTQY